MRCKHQTVTNVSLKYLPNCCVLNITRYYRNKHRHYLAPLLIYTILIVSNDAYVCANIYSHNSYKRKEEGGKISCWFLFFFSSGNGNSFFWLAHYCYLVSFLYVSLLLSWLAQLGSSVMSSLVVLWASTIVPM